MEDINSNELPLGDLEFLKQLAEHSGVALVRELVACAPVSVEKEVETIRHAIQTADSPALKMACHALKGACYSVKMVRLGHYVREVEKVYDNIEEAKRIFPTLELVGQSTINWWHEILDSELLSET